MSGQIVIECILKHSAMTFNFRVLVNNRQSAVLCFSYRMHDFCDQKGMGSGMGVVFENS